MVGKHDYFFEAKQRRQNKHFEELVPSANSLSPLHRQNPEMGGMVGGTARVRD